MPKRNKRRCCSAPSVSLTPVLTPCPPTRQCAICTARVKHAIAQRILPEVQA